MHADDLRAAASSDMWAKVAVGPGHERASERARAAGSDQSRLRDAVSSPHRSECVLLHPRRILAVVARPDSAHLFDYILANKFIATNFYLNENPRI